MYHIESGGAHRGFDIQTDSVGCTSRREFDDGALRIRPVRPSRSYSHPGVWMEYGQRERPQSLRSGKGELRNHKIPEHPGWHAMATLPLSVNRVRAGGSENLVYFRAAAGVPSKVVML